MRADERESCNVTMMSHRVCTKPSTLVGRKLPKMCTLALSSRMGLGPARYCATEGDTGTDHWAPFLSSRLCPMWLTVPLQCFTNLIFCPSQGEARERSYFSLCCTSCGAVATPSGSVSGMRPGRVSWTLRSEVVAPCNSPSAGGSCKKWGVNLGETSASVCWDLPEILRLH